MSDSVIPRSYWNRRTDPSIKAAFVDYMGSRCGVSVVSWAGDDPVAHHGGGKTTRETQLFSAFVAAAVWAEEREREDRMRRATAALAKAFRSLPDEAVNTLIGELYGADL